MTATESAAMDAMALELHAYRQWLDSVIDRLTERKASAQLKTPAQWPRFRDIPAGERILFWNWLQRHEFPRPVIGDLSGLATTFEIPQQDQDAYYPQDYEQWKASR